MSKYDRLREYLENRDPAFSVSLTLTEISEIVGGLPSSASDYRPWWANSTSPQSNSWMNAGRLIQEVVLGNYVVFSPASASTTNRSKGNVKAKKTTGVRVQKPKAALPILDGVAALEKLVKKAGYESTLHAVAAHSIFLHPEAVLQTEGKALFPIVRDPNQRGVIDFEKKLMYDDNSTPSWLFERVSQRRKGPDIQYNHVWTDAKNVESYTALWNLCVTPAFLAKTTDGQNHPEVTQALKYRSYELFGFIPVGEEIPERPNGYETLLWEDPLPPVENLESVLRISLKSGRKSRPATCARELGWLFSGGEPDRTI